jgi:hypothetical protein
MNVAARPVATARAIAAAARGTSIALRTVARLQVWIMEQQMLIAAEADSAEVIRCIDDCERCHRVCLRTAMTYCLEQGGEHVEPPYFRLMLACAQMCSTTADALLSAFASYEQMCALCANICRTCAASCERIGDMEECVEICRRCAERCERLSGGAERWNPPGPAEHRSSRDEVQPG